MYVNVGGKSRPLGLILRACHKYPEVIGLVVDTTRNLMSISAKHIPQLVTGNDKIFHALKGSFRYA